MHATVIQMYTTTTGAAAATIDVPADGVLVSMHLLVMGALNADGESVSAEVSFGSTAARTVNDARQVLGVIEAQMGLLTSGASSGVGDVLYDFRDGVQVFAGERIYLHTTATTGTMTLARAMLVFELKGFQPRRR